MRMYDEADVVAHRTLTEKYLKKFGVFLEEHSKKLVQNLKWNGTENLQDENEKISTIQGKGTTGSSVVAAYPLTHNIWNFYSDPIQLSWTPLPETKSYEELITVVQVNGEGNPDIQKVILVLVSLTSQINDMKSYGWKTFVEQIVLYGDGFESDPTSVSVTEGDGHLSISKFLPVLYELAEFANNTRSLASHFLQQLCSLFKDSRPHVVSIANVYLPSVFKEFADLLSLMVVLDEIIGNQSIIQEHFTKYKQMIKSVRADSANFGVDSAEKLLKLEKGLTQLQIDVIGSNMFRNLISGISQDVARSIGRGVTLCEKFIHYLTTTSSVVERDFFDGNDILKPVGLASMYILVVYIFPFCIDAKKIFYKTVWEGLKKIPCVPVAGSLLWIPETFLNSMQPPTNGILLDAKTLQNVLTNRQNYLEQKVKGLPKELQTLQMQVCAWSLNLQEVMNAKDVNHLRLEDLSKRCNLILQGVKFAQSLSLNFRLVINMHAALGKPVTKQVVCRLCQILELLKFIEYVNFRHSVHICSSAMYIVQNVMHTALVNLKQALKSLQSTNESHRKMDELRSDSLSILLILENVFKGPPSKKRLLVARVALDWAAASCRQWKDDEMYSIIVAAVERISNLIALNDKIRQFCNGSAIYWHRIVLSTYFSCIYFNEIEISKLPLIFLIVQDCSIMLEKSPHREQAKKAFNFEIEGYIKTQLVEKLCMDVETELRLLSHSHLQVSATESSPFRQGVKELQCLLESPSFLFNERKINFKDITEYYLSKTFYNLASVALHDWQSYATMRVLAQDKYHLEILDDHLPGHTLEQGLDILEIVRNLNRFVVDFTYNLNNQVFVQVNSPNKHLDTVNIRHLANSMRTHGPGMANTTVNYTYHFLRTKIHAFSQFLYDEQIKSRLTKDIRQFKHGKQENSYLHASFPYDRALKFQRGIRKLGVTPDGLSPLDQFRILITHIGNALGFVRLVRSGGIHFLAGGCRFIPDLDDVADFDTMSRAESDNGVNLELLDSTRNIESALKTLTLSFSGGVNYFNLLVSAFQAPCRDTRNSHLKNFHVIIPALTLSYVDQLRSCKEKLTKKSKSSTVFTDDGFPMGVAYLLQVLGQDNDFDSLGWFSGVTQKLTEEKQNALQVINQSKKDEKLQQANTLTAKRVQDFLQEFHLLRYNLSSARIFFQQSENTTIINN